MTGEKYNINWKNRASQLERAYSQSYNNHALCDVTLLCDGEMFKAHRFVLASCSTYFNKIFQEVPQGQYPLIFLKDVSCKLVKLLLDFIYKGHVAIESNLFEEFFKTCESLQIKGLGDESNDNSSQRLFDDDVIESTMESPPRTPDSFVFDMEQENAIVIPDDDEIIDPPVPAKIDVIQDIQLNSNKKQYLKNLGLEETNCNSDEDIRLTLSPDPGESDESEIINKKRRKFTLSPDPGERNESEIIKEKRRKKRKEGKDLVVLLNRLKIPLEMDQLRSNITARGRKKRTSSLS